MKKILLTGATNGIGYETAKLLVTAGQHVLLHGRNSDRLDEVKTELTAMNGAASIQCYEADLSQLSQVSSLADQILSDHESLDVLINNAGVFKTSNPINSDGLDVRFVVNTHAPFLLSQRLLPVMALDGRVVNLSSAAQAPVSLQGLTGQSRLSDDMDAYAQSKLALTMWSRELALSDTKEGVSYIAVNPGSMLATKMVKDAFGVDGRDISIGANILYRASLSDEFANVSGQYFDNDSGEFAQPHGDALDRQKCQAVIAAVRSVLKDHLD